MTEHLSNSSLARLSEFVAQRMGFHFPRERWLDLERGIQSVSRAFEFDDVESCVHWLVSSPMSQSQIETLASHLTIGETYFFRETQSFDLLEMRVLPELINRRRDAERRLRIWSAGCASGEEPYSIAILLKRMIPDFKDWQITVLASDINPDFLTKAADGIYGEWSFRGTPPELKDRYFAKKPNGRFEIIPEIKRMVTFCYLNLVENNYPSLLSNTNAMDIILCRNVLMYFAPERAKQVVHKLHLSLLDGGWLIVSPCETSHVLFEQFVTLNYPGAIFYKKDSQKISARSSVAIEATTVAPVESIAPASFTAIVAPEAPGIETTNRSSGVDAKEPNRSTPEQTLYAASVDFYEQGLYEEAARMLAQLLAVNPRDGKAAALLARVYANQGKLAEASRYAEQAVAADKLNPSCHVLQATILEEQGAILEATRALQRAMYLDPNLVFVHFALGNIARRQEKIGNAAKHFDNARALLSGYSPDQVLPDFDGMTAGRLMEILSSTAGAAAAPAQRSIKTATSTARRSPTNNVKEALR
jgi:chemotaxis protein methyltransferase CheR